MLRAGFCLAVRDYPDGTRLYVSLGEYRGILNFLRVPISNPGWRLRSGGSHRAVLSVDGHRVDVLADVVGEAELVGLLTRPGTGFADNHFGRKFRHQRYAGLPPDDAL
jgi:hypothetical protein